MFRDINQSQLFYDGDDRQAFLDRAAHYKEDTQTSLYAYSLMDNHVHLLVQAAVGQLPLLAKKLALSYSHWFNQKYERSGYLFQGRYKSEPVETDEYLLVVLRYIHQNPVKVGKPLSYWTSYDCYVGDKSGAAAVDTAFILDVIDSNDHDRAVAEFQRFVGRVVEGEETELSKTAPRHVDDKSAIDHIKQLAGVQHCQDVCALPKERRDVVFTELKRQGCSVRQIARLTGANRGIVHKAWSSASGHEQS
jgi:REP element-mobilizing transposase RayT